MYNIPETVQTFINNTKSVVFSTCGSTPNANVVFFKSINEKGQIVLFDVFMDKTLKNLAENNHVSLVVYNDATLEGYQLKGTAHWTAEEGMVHAGNAITNAYKLTTKGAVIMDVEAVYNLAPGPHCGQML